MERGHALPIMRSGCQTGLPRANRGHNGKVGVLGISLGAQIASAASVGRAEIDALVLVDGGFPNGYSQPVRSLPPLLLIWGSVDRTFPLSIGRELQRTAQQLGGPVILDVYEGGAHDFFLRSGTRNAGAAHQSAARLVARAMGRGLRHVGVLETERVDSLTPRARRGRDTLDRGSAVRLR